MNRMALVRLIVFLLAWVNQLLASKGHQPLPVMGEEEVANVIALVVSIWTLVKDNSLKK